MLRRFTTLFLVVNLVVVLGFACRMSVGMELSHLRRNQELSDLGKRDAKILDEDGLGHFGGLFKIVTKTTSSATGSASGTTTITKTATVVENFWVNCWIGNLSTTCTNTYTLSDNGTSTMTTPTTVVSVTETGNAIATGAFGLDRRRRRQ